MSTLSADITATQTYLPDVIAPGYYTVDSEAIRVMGTAYGVPDEHGQIDTVTGSVVIRGIAGTTAATHTSGATLTRYYPEAPGGGDGIPQGGPLTAPLDADAQNFTNFSALEAVPEGGAIRNISQINAPDGGAGSTGGDLLLRAGYGDDENAEPGQIGMGGGLGNGTPGGLGFFSKAQNPVTQPVVPLTTPSVQDVIDALVALGLVSQSD